MCLDLCVKKLRERFGDKIAGVVFFGSRARGNHSVKSDYDFLVVVRDWPEEIERKKQIYLALKELIPVDVTVMDIDEKKLFKENMEVDYFLLNIVEEGKILFDPSKRLSLLFKKVKELIGKAGLERYRVPTGEYGWKTKDNNLKTVSV